MQFLMAPIRHAFAESAAGNIGPKHPHDANIILESESHRLIGTPQHLQADISNDDAIVISLPRAI